MKLIKNLNYKKILSLFLKQDGTPFFNAKGVAIGVFCGCFPFFGFQTLLGLFLARVAKGNLLSPLYYADSNTPISAIDIMYGHVNSIGHGNEFMAHKCGFTDKVLHGELKRAGFNIISIIRATDAYALHALAFKNSNISLENSNILLKKHLPYSKIIENR